METFSECCLYAYYPVSTVNIGRDETYKESSRTTFFLLLFDITDNFNSDTVHDA